MSEWQALGAGFAFYLILEGLMPFFNPEGFKRVMALTSQMDPGSLRKMGGAMMLFGVLLLFWIK